MLLTFPQLNFTTLRQSHISNLFQYMSNTNETRKTVSYICFTKRASKSTIKALLNYDYNSITLVKSRKLVSLNKSNNAPHK